MIGTHKKKFLLVSSILMRGSHSSSCVSNVALDGMKAKTLAGAFQQAAAPPR
jgi:hypothetical protein